MPIETRRALLGSGATTAAGAMIASTPRNVAAQRPGRTFVLVHGAWHGGWCWRRVADLLEAQGHKVFAPSLTGLADRSHLMEAEPPIRLATHIADIVGLFRWEGISDAVLCGHSYGGMVISGAVEALPPGSVRALVFLDAFVPANGEAVADLGSPAVRGVIQGLAARGERSMPPIPAAAFAVNERDRAWVDAMCTPQPLATLTDAIALTGARERIASRTYIRADGFVSPGFDAMRARVQAAGGWRVRELPCGHDAMVDMPGELAAMLRDAA
jgi:pimeloyl-ACP methyl ester carboxylesterase